MIRTAYLRVYEPATQFSDEELTAWLSNRSDLEEAESRLTGSWLVNRTLPAGIGSAAVSEGAFVRTVDSQTYICPWRTRLRMLAGLLAFRESVPEEVAEEFVPAREARRAAKELADLDDRFPAVRSHILHANWHVPLRWFAAFEPAERFLVEDRQGLRVRYETRVGDALARIEEVAGVLEGGWMEDGVVDALEDLREWLEEFAPESLLELDYGSVARMFSDDELADENCAAVVAACVDALGAGDGSRAGRLFGELTDRWATLRAHEVVN
jgi:hypothetical protein